MLKLFASCLLFFAFSEPLLIAQNGLSQADLSAMEQHQLTLASIQRLLDTNADLSKTGVPPLNTTDSEQTGAIDRLSREIASSSIATTIIQRHGYTPQAFSLENVTYLQTALAFAEGVDPQTAAKAHVKHENLELFVHNRAAIDALQRRYASFTR